MSITTIIIIIAVFAGAIGFSVLIERIQNKSVNADQKKEKGAKID